MGDILIPLFIIEFWKLQQERQKSEGRPGQVGWVGLSAALTGSVCSEITACLVNTLVLLPVTGGGQAGPPPGPSMGGKLHSRGDWPSTHGGPTCLPQQWFSEQQARAGWLEDEKQAHAFILKLSWTRSRQKPVLSFST